MTFLGVTKCCECWFLKFWACFDDFWRFFIIFYVKKMTFLPLLKIVKPLQRFRLNKVVYFCVIINVCPPLLRTFQVKTFPKKKNHQKNEFYSGVVAERPPCHFSGHISQTVYSILTKLFDIFHLHIPLDLSLFGAKSHV